MKVLINRTQGYYYHKEHCSLMLPLEIHRQYYTEVEQDVAILKHYRPCPLCTEEGRERDKVKLCRSK